MASEPVRIVNSVTIQRPPEQVFEYGATPRTWPEWHPTALSVTGAVTAPVHAGAEILEQDRFAFLRGCIRWRARESAPARGWTIDGVVDGVPWFRGTTTSITYTLSPTPDGTLLRRDMTYRVPSTFARWLDRLYFRAHNARQSQRAIENMKARLERATSGRSGTPS